MISASFAKGLLGAIALLTFYFVVISVISGWNFAVLQFNQNWYWILSLSIGFGIQMGLFTYLRSLHKAGSTGGVAAISGGTSAAAMVACRSHYLVNILPIIGIAGIATIIGQYQTGIFIIGLIFNLFGVAYMINKLVAFKRAKRKNEPR